MDRLYLKPSLCKAIAEYCEANGIEDINAFANRCAMQGFNIAKYGLSPGDNIERENNGIKDFKNETRKRKNPSTEAKGRKLQEEAKADDSENKEEVRKPDKEVEAKVTVRKIPIIKKDKND